MKNNDKKRIFVVGTDREKLFHLMSIVQSGDGSFYCNLGEKIDPKNTHWSYHNSGQVNFYIGEQLVDQGRIEPPSKIKRIRNFPTAIAHLNLLSAKNSIDVNIKLQHFNPTNVIYIDLSAYKEKSVNIHAFLFPPWLLDYIKTPFLFEEDILQILLETTGFPWIGFMVLATSHTAAGPTFADLRDKKQRDLINQLFEKRFNK